MVRKEKLGLVTQSVILEGKNRRRNQPLRTGAVDILVRFFSERRRGKNSGHEGQQRDCYTRQCQPRVRG